MNITKIAEDYFREGDSDFQGISPQEYVQLIRELADSILQMGDKQGMEVLNKIFQEIKDPSLIDYISKLGEHLGNMQTIPEDQIRKMYAVGILDAYEAFTHNLVNPPKGFNFSKQFGIVEPPEFIGGKQQQEIIDKALEDFHAGKINKDQIKAIMSEFSVAANSKFNWYKRASFIDMVKNVIRPLSRDQLFVEIEKHDKDQILKAIQKMGEESIAGFSGVTVGEIDDILFTCEDGELADILGVLKKIPKAKDVSNLPMMGHGVFVTANCIM